MTFSKSCVLTSSLVLFAGLPLTSCSTTGGAAGSANPGGLKSKASFEKAPGQLQRGVTKRESVHELFGAPKRREINPDGERWLYGSAAQKSAVMSAVGDQIVSTGIGMIPYAGGAINGLRSIVRTGRAARPGAWIDFDRQGVVRDYIVEVN